MLYGQTGWYMNNIRGGRSMERKRGIKHLGILEEPLISVEISWLKQRCACSKSSCVCKKKWPGPHKPGTCASGGETISLLETGDAAIICSTMMA